MNSTWNDGDNEIQITGKLGAWDMRLTRKNSVNVHNIRFTSRELQEVIDMLQECIPAETTNGKVLNPKNPEDLTAVEERYQDTSKSTDNLLGAIDSAKEIYENKRNITYVYVYNGTKDSTPIKPYLSLSRHGVPPDDYRKLLYIDGSNFEETNEKIIIRSL